jgi:hypothetical protein
MAKVEQYREFIEQIVFQYSRYKSLYGDVENQIIFDTQRDRYRLIHVGWEQKKRVHSCSMHLDIKDEKIWIQHNSTDVDLAEELLELGVPKEDIVLGFQPVYLRQYTDYAVS